jgi:ABC-type transport system involved in cytochrome c biogenesis permease subunit
MRHRLIFIFLLFLSASAQAASPLPMQDFGLLPIQHEGRIKPLDSFARSELHYLADIDTYAGAPAIIWLADTLFLPKKAVQFRLFQVNSLPLRQQLNLTERKDRKFSLAELLPGLEANAKYINELMQKDTTKLDTDEAAWLQLAERAARYINLLGSSNLFLPLGLAHNSQETYLGILIAKPDIESRLKKIAQSKARQINKLNAHDISQLETGMRMAKIRQVSDRADSLRILPPRDAAHTDWHSPWTAIALDPELRHYQELMVAWQNLATAYRTQNTPVFMQATQDIQSMNASKLEAVSSAWQLKLENFYYRYQPLTLAALLYSIATVLILLQHWLPANKLRFVVPAIVVSGICFHFGSLLTRILILMRAPVGTLYETVLFISLIIATFSAMTYQSNSHKKLAAPGIFLSALMLFGAPTLSAKDSLEVLAAVLNTNFWLSTHVIIITAAYAACLIAAVMANVILWQQTRPAASPIANDLPLLRQCLIISLFLTAFGTVLGGIWADQSWGRFWGWDPKENGALLIVLWLTWILHGRISGKMRGIHWIASIAALSMIVALSWFGVNLLGTGLHSYGFITGIASSLAAFCALQTGFIIYALWHYHAKKSVA